MAVLAAAQLLDELMGRNRNTNPNEVGQKLNWEDPQYCKYYMVKFCPHDLFVNTRADLGACPHIHDDEVKELFEKAEPNHKKLFYQDEFLRFCQSMISDVERKIQKGKQRLELMNTKIEMPAITSAQNERNQEQIRALSDRIANLEAETEQAGIRGNVEQAQGLMKLCDQLKDEKEQLSKQTSENTHWSLTAELAAAQEKQMEVCAVCGAFLIVGDAQQRIDDHLMGKQHVGYFRLKEAFEEISKEREKQKQEREKRHDHDRDRRGGLGSGDRVRDRERERERERRHRMDRGMERDNKDRTDRDRIDRHRPSRDDRGSRHRESSDRDRKYRGERDRGNRGQDRSRDRDSRRRRSHSRGR